jgi:glycosyltransferase involved in cell wall biosynthesis
LVFDFFSLVHCSIDAWLSTVSIHFCLYTQRSSGKGTSVILSEDSTLMTKVAHLTSAHSYRDVRILKKECRSLVQAGYDVSLIASHNRDEVVYGVKVIAIPPDAQRLRRRASGAAYIYRKALQAGSTAHVYREALRLNADVYHFHDLELIPVGLLLRARGKRVIYDIHEDMPRSVLSRVYLPQWTRRPISWLAERTENLAARHFSALVAATPAIGARFQAIHPQTMVVNNYPLRDELNGQIPTAWDERVNSVAYVGTLTPIRGGMQMVEAMAYVSEPLQARLELAGVIWPDQLQERMKRLPGWTRVCALGVVDRPGVAQLLGRVQAGLVLFLPEPNHIQAQPNKLFEYMSAGIPVIASDFPLWRKLIETVGCGLLVDPLNPSAIADAIEFILTHPEEAMAMGRRGREAVERHYNWESEKSKLLHLYAQIGVEPK